MSLRDDFGTGAQYLCTECCGRYKLAVIREFGEWPGPRELTDADMERLPRLNPAVTMVVNTAVGVAGNAPVGITNGVLVCFEHLQVQSEAASKLLGA